VLTSLYKTLKKHPEEFLKFGEIALRYKVVNEAFQVTPENVAMYMATLESAIINQTSMGDIQKLTCPIRILHGVLDPVVVVQNLSRLDKLRSNITLRHVAAGHEVTGLMAKATVEEIKKWL